ncbi:MULTISPECIES: glycosyltransferase [Cyanophyceae]|uniref:glycosyltransferase n=1 Tax=Cyanophyceae TaxID=3028117 RepID=UPI00168624AE|nr:MULTISPECIES: glycosyltransferase [Cyanophyceae]MBD1918201.1 glycosyltransferase [Phormidium sp. FACHB-77]MBD2030233.1 glycosyltransferase [Phormidium sp. FACHB-322]MBD2051395.1 glycosyltransferase [Leptolyngbya sp. FACHB-60]
MEPKSTPFVSVIIPVFNDNRYLGICLNSLASQTYPSDHYEVIVVDNNSDEDIQVVTSEFDFVTLIHEPVPGSYIARNRGIKFSKGDVVAFTDADCIPAENWIEQGVAALYREENVGLVAGHIDLFARDNNKPNPFELYETIALAFPQDQFLANDRFGVTANLFTFKHVLTKVGLFDETLKSGGDRDWGQRVYAAGYRQIYGEQACVKHPARDSWESLRKRSVRIIGGKFDLLRANEPSDLALLKDFILFLKPPFRFFVRVWQDSRLKNFHQKFQFTLVMLRLRWVAIQERFLLQFCGGISKRS